MRRLRIMLVALALAVAATAGVAAAVHSPAAGTKSPQADFVWDINAKHTTVLADFVWNLQAKR